MRAGRYDPKKAPILWGYLVEEGAKKYTKKFSGPGLKWHEQFPKATRDAVAEEMARFFEGEAELGNYNDI